uniref:Venom Kazal domain peptide 3 n=1 Tax=Pristhesancus plagipennis TaxID=1955184 RepID=A0A2K8JRL3_PRIPG|nr:venom Kazal domain peptide 3 [Pristhesancus plagipennis]
MKLLFLSVLIIAGVVLAENIDDIVEKCHCGRSFDPTCGSNGYMFTNRCELRCYNNKTNSNVVEVDSNQCKKD